MTTKQKNTGKALITQDNTGQTSNKSLHFIITTRHYPYLPILSSLINFFIMQKLNLFLSITMLFLFPPILLTILSSMCHPSIHHYFLLAYTIFLIKIFVVFKGDKVLLCSPGCPASFKNFKHIDLLIMNMCIGVDIYMLWCAYGVVAMLAGGGSCLPCKSGRLNLIGYHTSWNVPLSTEPFWQSNFS